MLILTIHVSGELMTQSCGHSAFLNLIKVNEFWKLNNRKDISSSSEILLFQKARSTGNAHFERRLDSYTRFLLLGSWHWQYKAQIKRDAFIAWAYLFKLHMSYLEIMEVQWMDKNKVRSNGAMQALHRRLYSWRQCQEGCGEVYKQALKRIQEPQCFSWESGIIILFIWLLHFFPLLSK